MDSIFTGIGFSADWRSVCEQDELPSLMELEHFDLKIVLEEYELAEYRCVNFQDELIVVDSKSKPLKIINLQFTMFEPFFEYDGKAGFILGRQVCYTENLNVLDRFIQLISSKCILTHIEDDFVLLKQIGQGSTSSVCLAEDIKRTGRFAIKVISKTCLPDSTHISCVSSEISIMRKLNHNLLPKLYYVYEDSESIFLVMEFIQYGNLYERLLKFPKFAEEQSAGIFKKLLQALDYMHSNSIVHRDLKLENIILTEKNGSGFKIIDFGLAYESKLPQKRRCGSPGYTAPEILKNMLYDSKVDIFSAGVVLYELLYGVHPFYAESIVAVIRKNFSGKVEFGDGISEEAKNVLKLALEVNPNDRPTASELLKNPWVDR